MARCSHLCMLRLATKGRRVGIYLGACLWLRGCQSIDPDLDLPAIFCSSPLGAGKLAPCSPPLARTSAPISRLSPETSVCTSSEVATPASDRSERLLLIVAAPRDLREGEVAKPA